MFRLFLAVFFKHLASKLIFSNLKCEKGKKYKKYNKKRKYQFAIDIVNTKNKVF